ncbi:MAG: GAF domain-containing protein [Gammaproteobacteria bacterium]|nr:GAF domain-containing protein [Gammaproteobacteria bacterium]
MTDFKNEKILQDYWSRKQVLEQSSRRSDRQNLLELFVELLPKVIGAERCSVFISDYDNDQLWVETGTGVMQRQIEVPMANSMVGHVVRHGVTSIRMNMDKEPGAHKLIDQQTGFKTRNAICVPVISLVRDQVVGAIQVLNKHNNIRFTPYDKEILLKVAFHIQWSIENTLLNQDLLSMAEEMMSSNR